VLEVVDGLEQPHGHEGLEQEGHEGRQTEEGQHGEGHAPLDHEAVQHAVAELAAIEQVHGLVAQALTLEPPGALQLAAHGAAEEGLVALAEARGGRVFRRADAHVMAA
jgi:hypothetical protein